MMETNSALEKSANRRTGLFVLFLLIGLLLFVVFSHIRPVLPDTADPAARIVFIAMLLAAALWARGNPRFEKYWRILFACFAAAAAMAVDYYLPSRDWLLQLLDVSIKTPAGIALDKLDSSLILIVTILLLNKASGAGLGSLFLKKGNLKQGLTIGVIAFLAAAAGAIPVSEMFFGGKDLQIAEVLAWSPWVLIFVFGNAFNEELLFRGLFLGKYGPIIGGFLSNLVIAIPFALHHTGVFYTPDVLMFLAILLPLALAWGYVTQKTGSLWGAVLFHAGTDIPVVLAIFSSLR